MEQIRIFFYRLFQSVGFCYIFRYSETDIALPSKNRFCFQGNVAEVSRIRESMYNVFAPTFLFSCQIM
jgi:hypothetical protein